MTRVGILALLSVLGALATPEAAAQRRGGVGTAQGDILRGQGSYLVGAGWYNLNTARARNIDVDTWKKHNLEVQRLYRSYMIDRYKHSLGRKKLTEGVEQAALKKLEEDQKRWRESPTPEDVSSGNALNALAIDLADPLIEPRSWGTAAVALPQGLTLSSITFKIADSKVSSVFQNTVAIDRLLLVEGWPIWFRRPELDREKRAYETAVKKVVERCRQGVPLEARDVDALRESVLALQKKVPEVVTGRDGQRASAIEYVRQLDGATRLFAEQAYAESLIKDVSEHQAENVAQLLGFMRYHRLLFADPGKSPEAAQQYETIYQLLREQKSKLGIGNTPPGGLAAEVAATPTVDAPAIAGFWQVAQRDPFLLRADGKVFVKGEAKGTWTQEGRGLSIVWDAPTPKGPKRTMRVTLSEDGRSLEGKNGRGEPVTARRISPPARGPARKGQRRG
jgi:hypothetical protein